MIEAIGAISGAALALGLFGLLSRWEAGRRARMLRDVTRSTITPVKTFRSDRGSAAA